MRLPTYQVSSGITDLISTHKDIIKLIGPGYGQELPSVKEPGKSEIGYSGDCMYFTTSPELSLQNLTWTLQFQAKVESEVYLFGTNDALALAGGWYVTLSPVGIRVYTTHRINQGTPYASLLFNFPLPTEPLNVSEKHYVFMKFNRQIEIYCNGVFVNRFACPVTSTVPGFGMFGLTKGKVDTYAVASKLTCSYFRYDNGYNVPKAHWYKKPNATTKELNNSFFTTDDLSISNFDVNALIDISDFNTDTAVTDIGSTVGIVPKLTSNTQGHLRVFSSGDYDPNTYPLWRMFQGYPIASEDSIWCSTAGPDPKWVVIENIIGIKMPVNAMYLGNYKSTEFSFYSFKLQGRNANTEEWTTIIDRPNVPVANPPGKAVQYVGFERVAYSQYRLYIPTFNAGRRYIAINLWQLYNVATAPPSKVFTMQNATQEIIPTDTSSLQGNFILSASVNKPTFPRQLSVKLDTGSTFLAGTQNSMLVGQPFPWTGTTGYLVKNAEGAYVTKPLELLGFTLEETADKTTVRYPYVDNSTYGLATKDTFGQVTGTALTFVPVATIRTKTPVVLSGITNSSVEVVNATTVKLKPGQYMIDVAVTVANATDGVLTLNTVAGAILLQGMGTYGAASGNVTTQLRLKGVITIAVVTDIQLCVFVNVLPVATTKALPLSSLKPNRHTKLDIYRI